MEKRADFHTSNPQVFSALTRAAGSVPAIDARLRALVELRVSQINGCAYCLDMHTQHAREAGESQQRLDCLAAWDETPFFSDAERAALAWAESVTDIGRTRAPDTVYNALKAHYSEREIVDLTMIVAIMNMWNRVAVASRNQPIARSG